MSSNRLRSAIIQREPSNRLDSHIGKYEDSIYGIERKRLEWAYFGVILDCMVGRLEWVWFSFAF